MKDSDWDIRRKARAWDNDEADQRYNLTPEKLEMIEGKLLWSDDDRVALLIDVDALPNYCLKVRFVDGTDGVVDASRMILGPNPGVFEVLRDPKAFAE